MRATGAIDSDIDDGEADKEHFQQTTWLTAIADEARLEVATVMAVFLLLGTLIGWTVLLVPTFIKNRVATHQ
jgi:hypothetical protein